jgi:hypothetical protein
VVRSVQLCMLDVMARQVVCMCDGASKIELMQRGESADMAAFAACWSS